MEIERCTLCGSTACSNLFYVSCDNVKCSLYGPTADTKEAAITAWNEVQVLIRKGKMLGEAVTALRNLLNDHPESKYCLADRLSCEAVVQARAFLQKVKEQPCEYLDCKLWDLQNKIFDIYDEMKQVCRAEFPVGSWFTYYHGKQRRRVQIIGYGSRDRVRVIGANTGNSYLMSALKFVKEQP